MFNLYFFVIRSVLASLKEVSKGFFFNVLWNALDSEQKTETEQAWTRKEKFRSRKTFYLNAFMSPLLIICYLASYFL